MELSVDSHSQLLVHPTHECASTAQAEVKVSEVATGLVTYSTKTWWVLLTLTAPEYLLAKALGGWYSARLLAPEYQKFVAEDDVPWTKTHIHFADMGGFRIRFDDATDDQGLEQERGRDQQQDREQHAMPNSVNSNLEKDRGKLGSRQDSHSRRYGEVDWRLHGVHCRQEHPGLALSKKSDWQTLTNDVRETLVALEGNVWALSATQFLEARRRLIITLPYISEEDINDKSDSDALLKSLALLQVVWMVSQMIARAVRGLPSTQLEIMTLAFAGCAFFIYLLLWDRPRNVRSPVFLPASRFANASDVLAIAQLHDAEFSSRTKLPTCIRDSAIATHGGDGMYLAVTLGVGAMLFGCVHLIAWNFSFSSPVERLLWRTSSFITVFAPDLCLVGLMVAEKLEGRFSKSM